VRSREAAPVTLGDPTAHGAATEQFVLADIVPEAGAAGSGANGVGGSGGALLDTGAALALDGIPAGAGADVNRLVRVTGTINPAPPILGADRDINSAVATGGGAGNATTGSPADTTDRGSNPAAMRHLTVSTIEVTQGNCTAR
jgi:hypothetical protein